MKTASQILREAKALIGTPDKWLKGDYSNFTRDRFCAFGAIRKASGKESDNQPAISRFYEATDRQGFIFNDLDTTTHADVMAAFDRAIALAEADERKNAPWTQADTMRVIDGIVSTADGTRLDSSTVEAE